MTSGQQMLFTAGTKPGNGPWTNKAAAASGSRAVLARNSVSTAPMATNLGMGNDSKGFPSMPLTDGVTTQGLQSGSSFFGAPSSSEFPVSGPLAAQSKVAASAAMGFNGFKQSVAQPSGFLGAQRQVSFGKAGSGLSGTITPTMSSGIRQPTLMMSATTTEAQRPTVPAGALTKEL